jgi:3-hydroxybutyryl-CoA dehydrogenase
MSKNIESVAVLGGGFMGAGIAESASVAGLPVVIRELPEYIAAARTRLEKSMDSAVERGKLDAAKRDAAVARVTFTSELKDVAGSDVVIEAVPENLALKVSIMKQLNEIVSDDTILASNTSSIPIAELAGTVSRPDRVVGLHFFSPVPVMKLVEIVRALDTGDETVTAVKEFVTRLGKHPIETKDRSGFIVNFLLTSYLMGAVRMYEEGFASREDIDAGMKLGAGHPMGPLQLCDFIGVDV